jgi:hypothetical protein
MIPSTNSILAEDVSIDSYGSTIYQMDLDKTTIHGTAEDIESVKQWIYCALGTERYKYLAFSWDYGLYTMDLFGKNYDYVCAELERRIPDALYQDDRIQKVDTFEFSKNKNSLLVTFVVHTIYGDLKGEREVAI